MREVHFRTVQHVVHCVLVVCDGFSAAVHRESGDFCCLDWFLSFQTWKSKECNEGEMKVEAESCSQVTLYDIRCWIVTNQTLLQLDSQIGLLISSTW